MKGFFYVFAMITSLFLSNQAIAATQYEAENATLSGGANKNTNHGGYSGTGFVDGFFNSTTAQISFTVNASSAGSSTIMLHYSAGNGTSTNNGLYVNGTKIKNITCNATNNWDTWANETETVTLNAGNNTITYKVESSSGSCINLDYISVQGITYSLSVSNNGHGTTTPSGTLTVNAGSATSISATPSTGYQFSNWTVTSGTVTIANPSSSNTTVTLSSGNATIQANFSLVAYSLIMSNDGHGTTTPLGTTTVNQGVATSISATPSTGYQFSNWTITSGTATIANPSSASTTVTLTSGSATIRANFSALSYSLTMSNDGHGTTTPSGTITVTNGTATSISATPATGYQFSNWTITNGTATITNLSSSVTTVTLTGGNATIQANFSVLSYSLTMSNDGHGTTTPSGTVTVTNGTATSISATATSGYKFLNWTVTSGTATIANSSSDTTTVALTSGNATIRANFTAISYSLTMANDGHGTTTPSGIITVTSGAATSISATPATGYQFSNWTITSGTATITNPSSSATTVTLTGGNATIQANFMSSAYSLSMTNDGHGTTTPSGIINVNPGAATSISATASTGYQFSNWTVTSGAATIANSSSANTTVTLTSESATIRANFTALSYSLTMSNNGHGTTTPSGTVTVTSGTATSISATPDTGYQFSNWTIISGTATIADPSLAATTITLSSGNATVQAGFITVTPGVSTSRQLSLSGTLTDTSGNPLGASTPVVVDATVRLFATETGGTEIYKETFWAAQTKGITVDKGLFVARLGTGTTTFDLRTVISANANLFVEITIEGSSPDVLLPRTPLTAAAYSLTGSTSVSAPATVIHGTGNPNNADIKATIGTYFIDDNAASTWLLVNTGWKLID